MNLETFKLIWTSHAKSKMAFYKLSEQRVRRVLHSPKRVEEGIAPGTIAMLQSAGSKKHPYEIWVMIVKKRQATGDMKQVITRIISAWRYPGITKPRSEIALNIIREQYNDYLKDNVNSG